MSVKVTYKDLGLNRYLERAREAGLKALRVGVVGQKAEERNEQGVSYGAIALYNEFGTHDANGNVHIPERSFIRSTMKNRALTGAAAKSAALAYFKLGLDMTAALAFAAAPLIEAMRARILEGVPPPNKRSTVRQKGSDDPLIDTGGLLQHLGFVVVRHGGDVVNSGARVEDFEQYEVGSDE